MNGQQQASFTAPHRDGLIGPEALVLHGRATLPEFPAPVFGDHSVTNWDLNCLGRPANRDRSWGRIQFAPLSGSWLITAKECALIALAPSHPALIDAQATCTHRPRGPVVVQRLVLGIKAIHSWARESGLPIDLDDWTSSNLEHAYRHATSLSKNGHDAVLTALKWIHLYRSVLTHVTYTDTPSYQWHSAPRRAPNKAFGLATDALEPETWRALLRAALAYVQVFSSDILLARAEYDRVTAKPSSKVEPGQTLRVDRILASRTAVIPVRRPPRADGEDAEQVVHWRLLGLMLSDGTNPIPAKFHGTRPSVSARRQQVVEHVRRGQWTLNGLYQPAAKLDGRDTPWAASLDGYRLGREESMLRTACYIVIAALTMMRDSEVQELRRDALTEHYGLPAIRSALVKGNPHRSHRLWWITQPVADAIVVLERLGDRDHLFGSVRQGSSATTPGFQAGALISQFLGHINGTIEHTGLPTIPAGRVSPHMLRRTMAQIAAQEPGGEIAAGIQLKHAFRRAMAGAITGGYTAEHDRWRSDFLGAESARAAQELATTLDLEGPESVTGPGADRVRGTINVAGGATQRRLLATFPNLLIGQFNVCLGDRQVAQCLSSTDGPDQPLALERCAPGRCANSLVTPKHRASWEAEAATYKRLLSQRRLDPHNREQLKGQLDAVQRVLGRSTNDGEGNSVPRSRRSDPRSDEPSSQRNRSKDRRGPD